MKRKSKCCHLSILQAITETLMDLNSHNGFIVAILQNKNGKTLIYHVKYMNREKLRHNGL